MRLTSLNSLYFRFKLISEKNIGFIEKLSKFPPKEIVALYCQQKAVTLSAEGESGNALFSFGVSMPMAIGSGCFSFIKTFYIVDFPSKYSGQALQPPTAVTQPDDGSDMNNLHIQ